jgi:fructose-bisphosphate aldolase class II
MPSLQEYFADAKANRWAIGHFNFSTPDVLNAIIEAAKAEGAPCVMVGTSEGESSFIGLTQAAALVRAAREQHGYDVFLNADHFKSVRRCIDAIEAGYDTVLFEGIALPYEQNVEHTREVVKATGGRMMVEAELGYLKGSSEVQKTITITPEDYTQPERAADFIARTGVERLAVVFGNIHGIVTEQEEKLDIPHLERIVAAVPDTYLVLHGASGLPDEQVAAAIKAGMTNVHFNTELRIAYSSSLREELADHPDQTTPYKYLAPAAEAVREVVAAKVRLFMGA